MKSFRITWPDKNRSIIADLGYRYYLPKVICHVCEPEFKTWGSLQEFPAFDLDFLNDKDFGLKNSVSLDQFTEIKARILSVVGRQVFIQPGAAVGQMSGTASTTKLEDFVWGRIHVPQISKRAHELVAGDGIQLITAEMDMRCRGRKIDTHLALQVEPTPLLTEDNLRHFSLNICPRCGHYKRNAIGNKPYTTEGLEIKIGAWPNGQDLVISAETGRVIASERFMAAVQRHKLTGITFVHCGKYV
jgi:hypothetical protein